MRKTIATIVCVLACWLPAAADGKKKQHRSPVEQEFGAMMRKEESRAKKSKPPEQRTSRTTAEERAMFDRFMAASAAAKSAAQASAVRTTAPPRYNPTLPELRATNPKDGGKLFDVKPNAHIFAGNGNKRGKLADGVGGVQLNYGQSRQMKGADGKMHKYYYAFSTTLQGGKQVSGWVRASALEEKPRMPVVNAKPAPAGPTTTYRITGGDLNKRYGDVKVVRNYDGPHRAATDYGRLRGGYVNQTLTLPGKGGMSTDTWKTDTIFNRVKSVPSVVRPVYRPGGDTPVGGLRFVYGFVRTPTGPRYGWVAYRALKR